MPSISEGDSGESDSGEDGAPATAPAASAAPDAAAPQVCNEASDCDNGKFCDGTELCVDGECSAAVTGACPVTSACGEEAKRCDCDADRDEIISARCGGPDCDEDGDKHDAMECVGGDDCDDTDPLRYTGNAEVCDTSDHDEDCDMYNTAGQSKEEDPISYDRRRDQDGDGAMNGDCMNVDPVTFVRYFSLELEADCDDTLDTVGPDAAEICDGEDNDCDEVVDEIDGSRVPLSLQEEFCFDGDGDDYGRRDRRGLFCSQPRDFAPCRFDEANGEDCNDTDREVHPGHKVTELCDGQDNDCDGKIDQADDDVDPLPDQPTFYATDLLCDAGEWRITSCPDGRLWCNTDTTLRGCETDASQLTSCRACQTDCRFHCGEYGCDEVRQIAAGFEHTCVLTQEGVVACWGRAPDGRLGDGTDRSASVPRTVLGLRNASAIAAGAAHSCAIAGAEDAVYCWGSNETGQLANPDVPEYAVAPVPVFGLGEASLRGAVRIAAGEQTSCAVMRDRKVACWGATEGGRLGDLTVEPGTSYPVYVAREQPNAAGRYEDVANAAQVALGNLHGCLLTVGGVVECWGSNVVGQLGDNRAVELAEFAKPVAGLSGVTMISAGSNHTCALSAGDVYCWGLNSELQLGREASDEDAVPRRVEGLSRVVRIAAGLSFTCALTDAGVLSCWGDNSGTQLVTPSETQSSVPVPIPIDGVAEIALGWHGCATRTEGRPVCWGENSYGQLGVGFNSVETMGPVEVVPMASQ
jgi:alpha-tubulin suppressor-like RCC1 family protein